jgi:hypothetical protein
MKIGAPALTGFILHTSYFILAFLVQGAGFEPA